MVSKVKLAFEVGARNVKVLAGPARLRSILFVMVLENQKKKINMK